MTRLLREAAEVRDHLERTRSAEDDRLARRQAEDCLAFIAARDQTTMTVRGEGGELVRGAAQASGLEPAS